MPEYVETHVAIVGWGRRTGEVYINGELRYRAWWAPLARALRLRGGTIEGWVPS